MKVALLVASFVFAIASISNSSSAGADDISDRCTSLYGFRDITLLRLYQNAVSQYKLSADALNSLDQEASAVNDLYNQTTDVAKLKATIAIVGLITVKIVVTGLKQLPETAGAAGAADSAIETADSIKSEIDSGVGPDRLASIITSAAAAEARTSSSYEKLSSLAKDLKRLVDLSSQITTMNADTATLAEQVERDVKQINSYSLFYQTDMEKARLRMADVSAMVQAIDQSECGKANPHFTAPPTPLLPPGGSTWNGSNADGQAAYAGTCTIHARVHGLSVTFRQLTQISAASMGIALYHTGDCTQGATYVEDNVYTTGSGDLRRAIGFSPRPNSRVLAIAVTGAQVDPNTIAANVTLSLRCLLFSRGTETIIHDESKSVVIPVSLKR